MLAGSYPMSVDAKARVTLPAVFRKQLIDGDRKTIYLVPMNGCVNGFTLRGSSGSSTASSSTATTTTTPAAARTSS